MYLTTKDDFFSLYAFSTKSGLDCGYTLPCTLKQKHTLSQWQGSMNVLLLHTRQKQLISYLFHNLSSRLQHSERNVQNKS